MKTLYKLKLGMLLVALFAFCGAAFAQEFAGQSVSGKVIDENGSAVAGASITEKGTANGTLSDSEGKYSLKLTSANATVVVTFIGYKTIEEASGGRAIIDFSLQPDVSALQEVVVTGYSSERKADVVTAISQVSATNTVVMPQSDIGQSLQGRVAGVQVTSSGQPGQLAQVRIRGFGSFTNNAPLYIIDGVPTFDNSQINPYDVESQTILKDAGAASIYGARAAAGVIVITTKHGKYDGKTNVSLDVNTGATMPGNGIKNLNPQQQADMVYRALRQTPGSSPTNYGPDLNNPQLPDYILAGVPGGPNAGFLMNGDPRIQTALNNYNIDPNKGQLIQVIAANKSGTDWYKAMTRVAPVTRVSLGLSGGNDRAHYYTNFTYYDQQGIVLNQYLRRFNVRLNSEFKPIKNVRVGENLMLTYRENPALAGTNSGVQNGNGNAGGSSYDENTLNYAYRMPTIIPVHDVRGNWAGTQAPGFNNPANPVAAQSRLSPQYNQNVFAQAFGNAYIEIDPIKHLTLRSSFGGSTDFSHSLQLTQQTYENAENTSANVFAEGSSYNLNYTFTNTARYENKFGDHSIKVLAGYEAIKNNTGRYLAGQGLNPYSIDPNYISITNTSSTGRQVASGPYQPYSFASLFGRLDYGLKDKYYLSVTARRDGSSVFGPNNRYGVFPAISGAWRISSEDFMQGIPWLSDLKIRAGWGKMGNSNALLSALPTNAYTLYGGNPSNGYDINGTNNSVVSGFIPQQIGNPAGKWETSTTTNIGVDATLFDGTFDVVVEFWQRNTNNLLYNPNFLNTGGVLPNNPYVNVGSMTNKGIDLQLTKRIKVNNDLNITLDGNISPFQNKITAISNNVSYFEPSQGTIRNLSLVRNMVGESMSSYFGYKMIGYFQNATDVANSPVQDGAAPGRFKYQNISGSGTITPADRTVIGSPIPKFTYGFNVNVQYKHFFLVAFLYGSYGNKIMNFSKWYNDFYSSFPGTELSASTLQSWKPENTPAQNAAAKTPILENVSNFSTNTQANSWYVESGSYARLKNLQIGYDIPKGSLSKVGLNRVKVYLQATNLFTITKYTGKDPEIVGNVDVTRGIDVGSYPATRQYMIGLNVGF